MKWTNRTKKSESRHQEMASDLHDERNTDLNIEDIKKSL